MAKTPGLGRNANIAVTGGMGQLNTQVDYWRTTTGTKRPEEETTEFCGILSLAADAGGWQGKGATLVALIAATQASLLLLRIPQQNSIL